MSPHFLICLASFQTSVPSVPGAGWGTKTNSFMLVVEYETDTYETCTF